jgi:4-hydroxybenzoate polyprenyltransferase
MDHDSDRGANLRHFVVLAGPRRALRAIFAIHAACFLLLLLYEPGVVMLGLCAGLALEYLRISRNLTRKLDDPAALLRFRRGYRRVFAVLLLALSALRLAEFAGDDQVSDLSGPASGTRTSHESVVHH